MLARWLSGCRACWDRWEGNGVPQPGLVLSPRGSAGAGAGAAGGSGGRSAGRRGGMSEPRRGIYSWWWMNVGPCHLRMGMGQAAVLLGFWRHC